MVCECERMDESIANCLSVWEVCVGISDTGSSFECQSIHLLNINLEPLGEKIPRRDNHRDVLQYHLLTSVYLWLWEWKRDNLLELTVLQMCIELESICNLVDLASKCSFPALRWQTTMCVCVRERGREREIVYFKWCAYFFIYNVYLYHFILIIKIVDVIWCK